MNAESRWAAEFAAKHGLHLRYETPLPGGVPAYKYEDETGQSVVVLDSALPEERLNFSLAHEAAHVLLGHAGDLTEAEEFDANRLASALLLPDPPFSGLAHENLRLLKQAFPHASFEAIARRRMQFVPGALTIMDNGRITRRMNSDDFAAPPRVTPAEKEALERCLKSREDLDIPGEEVRLHGYYVDEGRGVVRVLLIVEEA